MSLLDFSAVVASVLHEARQPLHHTLIRKLRNRYQRWKSKLTGKKATDKIYYILSALCTWVDWNRWATLTECCSFDRKSVGVCFTVLSAALKGMKLKVFVGAGTLTLHNNQKFLIFQDLRRRQMSCHKHNMQVLDVVKTFLHAFLFQEPGEITVNKKMFEEYIPLTFVWSSTNHSRLLQLQVLWRFR